MTPTPETMPPPLGQQPVQVSVDNVFENLRQDPVGKAMLDAALARAEAQALRQALDEAHQQVASLTQAVQEMQQARVADDGEAGPGELPRAVGEE